MTVAIIGAGLSGCLLAAYLARRDLQVTLYERRADPRTTAPERGRSINLAISARGLDALRRIGLEDQVMADALPMRGRRIHDEQGRTVFTPYSADGTRAINSISRGALNATLLDAALASDLVSVAFDHRLVVLEPDSGLLEFDTPHGEQQAKADVVIGCDGAFSAVRARLQTMPGFDYRQDFLDCQYKELTIPARGGDFAMDPDALHIWPRGGAMMIALPNPDRSFTCTLFWPPSAFAEIRTGEQAVAHFEQRYADAVPLMPRLAADYEANPIGNLVTIRCRAWTGGRAALVGDAAHAIVPFFGQGANAAFEDVVELDRCLSDFDGDWGPALAAYQSRRIEHTNAIADMALDNFVEMSTKSGSRLFQLQKGVQHALERWFPEHYVSRYELVSFTTLPYADVVRRTTVPSQVRAVATGAVFALPRALRTLTHREERT
jgi:kynurenine 3-monooxygenase